MVCELKKHGKVTGSLTQSGWKSNPKQPGVKPKAAGHWELDQQPLIWKSDAITARYATKLHYYTTSICVDK